MNIRQTVIRQVVVRYVAEDEGREFSDALVLSAEEFDRMSEKDIEAAQRQRFDAWLAAAAAPPRLRTADEKQIGLDALVRQKAELEAEIERAASDPDVELKSIEAILKEEQDEVTEVSRG